MALDILFLGTGSGYPTPNRGASCMGIRYEGNVWLVDCGEGTQTQIMSIKTIKPSAITKIFITHLHGDHLFGLPGLLCTLSMAYKPPENGENREEQVIEIYGPHGLRRYIRENLSLSRSILTFKYVVHELMPVKEQYESNRLDDPDWDEWKPEHSCSSEQVHVSELHCSRNIEFDINTRSWPLIMDGTIKVVAGILRHRVPTFGYVFTEDDKPGKLLHKKLIDFGVPPGSLFGKIKRGEPVLLDDGRVAQPCDFVGPQIPGRKIAVLQDTCFSEHMLHLCQNCNVLIHEATNEESHREKCVQNGHSTAIMAAEFLVKSSSKHLILTHFSQRYKPDSESTKDEPTTSILVKEASTVADENIITAAYDGLVFNVKSS